jgi:hypothetical protein
MPVLYPISHTAIERRSFSWLYNPSSIITECKKARQSFKSAGRCAVEYGFDCDCVRRHSGIKREFIFGHKIAANGFAP